MKKKLVSVVIPARNRVEFTTQAINSVLNQRCLKDPYEIEIILVDNDSDPPLKHLLSGISPKVKIFRFTRHRHPGSARNYGLKFARGDFIAFLDNDDQWRPNFLSSSLQVICQKPAPATVCLTSPYFYGSYPVQQKIKLTLLNYIRTSILAISWLLNDRSLPVSGFYLCQISHMLFSAKAINGIRFNEKVTAAEDWEFIADISKKKQIHILPQTLLNFRYEIKSNTNTKEVRHKKWDAYRDLVHRLPKPHKQGILYHLFLGYIRLFS